MMTNTGPTQEQLKVVQRVLREHDTAAVEVATYLGLLRENREPLDWNLNQLLDRFEDARKRMYRAGHDAGWHAEQPVKMCEACS